MTPPTLRQRPRHAAFVPLSPALSSLPSASRSSLVCPRCLSRSSSSFSPSFHPHPHPSSSPHAPSTATTTTTAPRMHAANEAPDYTHFFDPSNDSDYAEVRAFSFGPSRNGCALITLYPVDGGPHAFKMSVTAAQAEAIRRALSNPPSPSAPPSTTSTLPSNNLPTSSPPTAYPERPTTHDLAKSVVDATGAVVAQAAITHMVGDVFIARVWLRPPTNLLQLNQDLTRQLVHIDARPSDALALATRAAAPLYLHKGLLSAWGVPIDAVRVDASQGRCELVQYADARASTAGMARAHRAAAATRGDVFGLALLKTRLDLAVRLERFSEAASIRDKIQRVCPVDFLKEEVEKAVREERFQEAAELQDQLTLWRARLRMWEKGDADLVAEAGLAGWEPGMMGGGYGQMKDKPAPPPQPDRGWDWGDQRDQRDQPQQDGLDSDFAV